VSATVLDHLSKNYPGGIAAVRDFNLEVADGELMVLVGPSGCGKSTLLRMIAGLEEISSGTVAIGGRVVNRLPPRDRDVAMVLQNYALYPHWTVRQNMAFGLRLRRAPSREIDARIAEAAGQLGIGHLLDRRPGTLSGGEQQRVALGRALVRRPAVFLLDEPLSDLDARLRAEMRIEIKRLHRRFGATMIYVTHDQTEALTLGDRVAVLNHGVVEQVADPVAVYDRPANRFVAGFMGMPPMNFLTGRIVGADGRAVFRADAGFAVPLDRPAAQMLADCQDCPVVLGVRPEHVTFPDKDVGADVPIYAEVDLVEPLGAETCVYVTAHGSTLVGRADSHRTFRSGQPVAVTLTPGRLHFFDPETGRALA
jgi:multiple sugar transport system ATP-binding protein